MLKTVSHSRFYEEHLSGKDIGAFAVYDVNRVTGVDDNDLVETMMVVLEGRVSRFVLDTTSIREAIYKDGRVSHRPPLMWMNLDRHR